MRSEPNTTSSTFGVTDGFCGALSVVVIGVPFIVSASGAIGVEVTRRRVVHIMWGRDVTL